MAKPMEDITWKELEPGCVILETGSSRSYRTGDWRTSGHPFPDCSLRICHPQLYSTTVFHNCIPQLWPATRSLTRSSRFQREEPAHQRAHRRGCPHPRRAAGGPSTCSLQPVGRLVALCVLVSVLSVCS